METRTVTLTTEQLTALSHAAKIVLLQLGPGARLPEHEAYLAILSTAKDVLVAAGGPS